MTDPTAVPINMFENDRELMVVTPMPGVSPEDISIDVTDDGKLTLRSGQRGEGQERVSCASGRMGRTSGRSISPVPSTRAAPT
jgi:HSP20 family molecular chaperone IbpA